MKVVAPSYNQLILHLVYVLREKSWSQYVDWPFALSFKNFQL